MQDFSRLSKSLGALVCLFFPGIVRRECNDFIYTNRLGMNRFKDEIYPICLLLDWLLIQYPGITQYPKVY